MLITAWQQYLMLIKAFNYSLFANAYMLVKTTPSVPVTSAVFNESFTKCCCW